LIKDKTLLIPDRGHPVYSSSGEHKRLPAAPVWLEGSGPKERHPSNLTAMLQTYDRWFRVDNDSAQRFGPDHPWTRGQMVVDPRTKRDYMPGDPLTILMEFNAESGALRSLIHYAAPCFKVENNSPRYDHCFFRDLPKELSPRVFVDDCAVQSRKWPKDEERLARKIMTAYERAEDIRQRLVDEKKAATLLRDKDGIQYFVNALERICAFDPRSMFG